MKCAPSLHVHLAMNFEIDPPTVPPIVKLGSYSSDAPRSLGNIETIMLVIIWSPTLVIHKSDKMELLHIRV